MVKAFAARLRRIADRLDPPAAPEPRPWIVVTGPTTNTGSLAGTTWRINTTN